MLVLGSVNGIERKWYLGRKRTLDRQFSPSSQVVSWYQHFQVMCSTGEKFQSDFPSAKRRFGCCHLSPPNFFKMKSWEIPSKSSFHKFQTKKNFAFFKCVQVTWLWCCGTQKKWWRWKIFRKAFNPFDQLAARPKSSSTTQIEVLTSTTLEAWFVPSLEVAMKRFVWSHSRWWVVDVPAFWGDWCGKIERLNLLAVFRFKLFVHISFIFHFWGSGFGVLEYPPWCT